MVCGKRDIDIEYLKANTRYRPPMKVNDKTVEMMWRVLESFNSEQRQMFLRFVWGQSRLPYNPADFTQKFEITPAPRNDDIMLPISRK